MRAAPGPADAGAPGAGRADAAWAWWRAISPAHRSADAAHRQAYGGEPYVTAGDIYSEPPWTGRCGWTWYTGSAGWAWRAATESLCGVRLRRQQVLIEPCLPPGWRSIEVRLGKRRLRLAANAEELAHWRRDRDCLGLLAAHQWHELASLRPGGFYLVDLRPRRRSRRRAPGAVDAVDSGDLFSAGAWTAPR